MSWLFMKSYNDIKLFEILHITIFNMKMTSIIALIIKKSAQCKVPN